MQQYDVILNIPGSIYYRPMAMRVSILDLPSALYDIVNGSAVNATLTQIAECVKSAIAYGKADLGIEARKTKPFITVREVK